MVDCTAASQNLWDMVDKTFSKPHVTNTEIFGLHDKVRKYGLICVMGDQELELQSLLEDYESRLHITVLPNGRDCKSLQTP